jgi:hypothetical protein
MAKSLASLRKVVADTPPLFVIYGDEKLGKTTFASEWPDPVFIQCEQGTPGGVDLNSFGEIESFDDVTDAMQSIITGDHNYKTVVVDPLDTLERLIHQKVCQDNGWSDIDTPGWGKGYLAAENHWNHFLRGCRVLTHHLSIAVVLISHYKQITIKSPTSDPYSKYVFNLHEKAGALVKNEADIIGYLNTPLRVKEKDMGFNKKVARAVSTNARIIDLEGAGGFIAGNRYSMPSSIEYVKGKGYEAIKQFFPQPTGLAQVQQAAE